MEQTVRFAGVSGCENAEAKLQKLGFEFPWLSEDGVSFKGLGGSTKTLGDKRMVFCVSCDNKNANSENQKPLLPGILDCHVTTGDDTPLLLSLFAQSTLGLLKDLKNFVCYVQRNNGEMWKLPLYRTKGSNLLAVNLTGGFRGLTRIPRPLRPYRTPLPRPNQPDVKHRDQVETERLSIKNEPTCEEDLWNSDLVVTGNRDLVECLVQIFSLSHYLEDM